MMINTYLSELFNIKNKFLILCSVVLLSSCASIPPPTSQIATSKDAIKNATQAGSNQFAPLQLNSAMEKMATAELAMKNKNYELARRLAEEAQVEAELALAITNSSKAQLAADAIHENSRVLRQEIERKAK